MSDPLAVSYRHCQRVARRTGKNFYWSFLTLPRPLRREMCVLYTFMRQTDDLGDEESQSIDSRKGALVRWRDSLRAALESGPSGTPALRNESALTEEGMEGREVGLPALADVVRRRNIPVDLLHEVISGVESDLSPRTFDTLGDLEAYCYQVAGAVGLCCIHIWGFEGAEARARAIDCGTAFQLTNILRDLREDAGRGRVYLPREDLERFSVAPEELLAGAHSNRLRQLMAFEVQRARGYYARGTELLPLLSRPGRRIHAAMLRIYGGLLDEIERRDYDVFTRRVELPASRKLWIALRSWWRPPAGVAPADSTP